MSAGCTPAVTAISRSRAPAKPRAANSRSPASRMRARVAAALRSRFSPVTGARSTEGGPVSRLGRSIPGFELNHVQLFEATADARREQAEALHVGNDLREDELAEETHRVALHRDGEALLDGHAHVLPHLVR